MTLQDALDIAHEDGDEVTDIYIEPPENNLTDEDSADEDEASPSGNLGARQLSAGAEIVFVNNRRLGGLEADLDPEVLEKEELENIALDQLMEDTSGQFENDPENRKIPLFRIVTEPSYYTFAEEADIEPVKCTFPKEDYSKYKEMSCVELFELFFGNDVLDHIITATRSYSSFRNRPDINVSIAEMKVYIGILLLSGYNNLPSKRSYWENANDMKNVMVSDAMRRDRFLKISRFIHFANFDTIDISDKMYKLRSLTDLLKTKFLDHFVPEQNLSFDESMIRYFGRNGSKQFIRDKPVRLGYKVWCLNAPSGYLVNFEVHQGENPRSNKRFEHLFGKAAAVLVQMIVKMGEKRLFNYNLFFDHLITGTNLLCTLKANGYGATGTIRENRLPQNCPLVSKSQMEKQTRGDFCSTFEKECGILYVRWMDNNVVTMASTCLGTKPVRSVDRYSRKEKNIISISRPNLVLQYNRNACGTDQMNNNISCYRIGIHSQKWYWPIFTYLMDAAVQNAWTLYRKSGRNISQLEFRRNIVQTYLTNFKMPARAIGRMPKAAGSNSRVSNDVRYDGLYHYVIPVPGGKRRRCAGTNCTTSGRTMCSKCDIGLCLSCFKNFHVN